MSEANGPSGREREAMSEGTGQILVPGMVPTGPAIVTSRFDVADGYTIDGYVRTGGYTALRKALTEHDAEPRSTTR